MCHADDDDGDCLISYYKHLYSTNFCISSKPPNYYTDNDAYVPCHPNCNGCTKPDDYFIMNCNYCKSGYHMTEDTKSCYTGEIDYYYLASNKYKKCPDNCLKCTASGCVNCMPGFYLNSDTKTCYSYVILNYYYDFSSKKLVHCHAYCSRCNSQNNENCDSCNYGYHLTEDTRSCLPSKQYYYLDIVTNYLRKCHSLCATCYASPT